MVETRDNDLYEEELLNHEEEDDKAPDYEAFDKGSVGIHSPGFREPKRLRSVVVSGFKHPSEVLKPSLEITMERNQNEEERKMVKNIPEEDGVQLRETTEEMSDLFDCEEVSDLFECDAFAERVTRFCQSLRNKRKTLAVPEEGSSNKKELSETNITHQKSDKEEQSDHSSKNIPTNSGSDDSESEDWFDIWVPEYLKNSNKLQEWDSDSDLVFDNYGIDIYPPHFQKYDVRASEGINHDVYVYGIFCKKEEYDAPDQFVDHYFSVCKSRGYDFDTVPPPENMHWSSCDWIYPYPMNNPEEKQEINDALQEALVVIHEKTGKRLKLEQIVKVNLWNRYTGRHFFITFEATDEQNSKGTYQTRLVFSFEGHDPPCSLRLLDFVGDPGTVHAFRPKPT